MTQYNTLNIKFSDSKLNKVKSRTKYGTEVTLNLSSNLILIIILMIMDKTNFPNKLLLPDKQASRLHKAFANGSIVKNCTIRSSSSWHTHFRKYFFECC